MENNNYDKMFYDSERFKLLPFKPLDIRWDADITGTETPKRTGKGIKEVIEEYPLTPEEAFEKIKPALTVEDIKKAMEGVPFVFGTGGEISNTWDTLWNKPNGYSFTPVELTIDSKKYWTTKEEIDSVQNQYKQSFNYKEMEQTNQTRTEGQKRVRLDFNPNNLKRVQEFKSIMASAIDEIAEAERRIKNDAKDHPELGDFLREAATAKTELQKASMCGTLALTHQVTFDTFESVKIGNSSNE